MDDLALQVLSAPIYTSQFGAAHSLLVVAINFGPLVSQHRKKSRLTATLLGWRLIALQLVRSS